MPVIDLLPGTGARSKVINGSQGQASSPTHMPLFTPLHSYAYTGCVLNRVYSHYLNSVFIETSETDHYTYRHFSLEFNLPCKNTYLQRNIISFKILAIP